MFSCSEIIPKGFFPLQDNGTVFGGLQGAQDISFQAMQTLNRASLTSLRPTQLWQTSWPSPVAAAPTMAFIYIGLKPSNQRKISSSQVINRLRPKLTSVPGATVFLQAGQDLRIGGHQSNAQYQYTIQSDNIEDLVNWGPILLSAMKKVADSHRRKHRSTE